MNPRVEPLRVWISSSLLPLYGRLQPLFVDFGVWAFAWPFLMEAERKVRTPKGRIPRESGGAMGKPVATDSVTENIPPRFVWGKGEKGR